MSLKSFAQNWPLDFDYSSEVLCEEPGQFSIRGGLIDVYPVNSDKPARIDFLEMTLKKSEHTTPPHSGQMELFRELLFHLLIQKLKMKLLVNSLNI